MKSRFRFLSLLSLSLALAGAVGVAGCSQQQLQQAQTDIASLRQAAGAATQQVGQLQQELSTASQQLADARAAAATQPTADSAATIDTLQKAVTQIGNALNAAQSHSGQINAALSTAQGLVTAIQSGTPPDVAGLSAFGIYGTLAGILVTLGWSIYSDIKNGNVLKTVNGVVSQVAVLPSASAGTPAPASAATATAAPSSPPPPPATA